MSEGSRQTDREQRFRRLFVEHYPRVRAYAARRTTPEDADDIAALVFLTAWRRFEGIPEGAEAPLWLYGVARRVLSNQRRGMRRRQRLVARIRAEGPPEPVVDDDRFSPVLDALGHLKPVDQEILRLSAWEGLSPTEIGQVVGLSEGAVSVRMHRARLRMERRLRAVGFHGATPLEEGSGI